MERSTIELTLPDSQAIVTLYQYISHGQYKELQKLLLKDTKIDLSKLGDSKEDNEEEFKRAVGTVNADVTFDQQALLQRFLIKSIKLSDGTIVENTEEFVFNATINDGSVLQAKLSEIEESSNLSAEGKKK